MSETVMNCWEFLACGREPGGTKVEEFGVCPAAVFVELDGRNHGVNGGRACFIVDGTLCSGEPHQAFDQKLTTCLSCDFFRCLEDVDNLMETKLLTLHFSRR